MTLAETLERIEPADAGAMRRAEARHLTLTKPPGSLGRLEQVSIRLAGIYGTERPAIRGSAVIVAAGDHGVVAQGVTGYPQAVTAQMVRNFLAGGAAVSVMARLLGVRQIVADAGIATRRVCRTIRTCAPCVPGAAPATSAAARRCPGSRRSAACRRAWDSLPRRPMRART